MKVVTLTKSLIFGAVSVALVASASGAPRADELLSYEQVWTKVRGDSAGARGADEELAAARKAADRASRHWWPRVFADARAYTTDDAGLLLFSKLGSRSLSGSDLSPFAMNFPDGQVYQKATLGAELPLFEGGAKVAESRFRQKMVRGREFEKEALLLSEYAETAGLYGALLISDQQEKELLPIQTLVASTIARYELGAKGNPVGYSGLLGLKNLSHRIEGELEMIRARRDGARKALAEKAELPAGWQPSGASIPDFVADFLERGRYGRNGALETSYAVSAQQVMADGLEELKSAERARFLPRIALFAEGSYVSGNSANATAGTAGGFLQWELFSAPSFGAVGQAELTAAAARSRAEAARVRAASDFAKAERVSRALRDQMRLADRSLALLEEQSEAARKLFLNGSINALQLTEVFSRTVDLISAKAQMKEQYLNVNAQVIQLVPFEIPVVADGGSV